MIAFIPLCNILVHVLHNVSCYVHVEHELSTLGTRALILGSRNRREKNQIKNCCAGGSAWDPVVTDVPIVL